MVETIIPHILIIMMAGGYAGNSPAVTTARFEDEIACRAALEAIVTDPVAIKTKVLCQPVRSQEANQPAAE